MERFFTGMFVCYIIGGLIASFYAGTCWPVAIACLALIILGAAFFGDGQSGTPK